MPARLYYWLALGGTASAVGVALMVNHFSVAALVAFISAFSFVLIGGISELLLPGLVWWFGRHGSFERAINRHMREGEKLLKQGSFLGREHHLAWSNSVKMSLVKYLGCDHFHEVVNEFEAAGWSYTYRFPDAKGLVRQQYAVLQKIREDVRSRKLIIILDSSIKL